MVIKKQLTICKSETELKIYPESKNEIGLWIGHLPCFITPIGVIHDIQGIINKALQYSNSDSQLADNVTTNLLKELHIKSWNKLYKTYKIFSFSLTENNIIITPYIYTQKGVFPNAEAKSIFDKCDYNGAIGQIVK